MYYGWESRYLCLYYIYLTCKWSSVGQSEGLLIPRSWVRFRLKPENSNSHGFEPHRPSIKGTKLPLKVIKAIIIFSCPVRYNVAHSYRHQGRRARSWPSAYTPYVWGCCSMLISCQDTIHTWFIWKECAVLSSVVLLGQEIQAFFQVVACILVGTQVEAR